MPGRVSVAKLRKISIDLYRSSLRQQNILNFGNDSSKSVNLSGKDQQKSMKVKIVKGSGWVAGDDRE